MAIGLQPVGPPTRRPTSALGLPAYGGPAANFNRPPAVRQEAQPGGGGGLTGRFPGGGFSARGASRDILQQGIQAGVFSPKYLQRLGRRRALANYLNTRRRGRTAAGLYAYGDPFTARGAGINADIAASQSLGNELTNADLASYGSYADTIKSLLGGERSAEEAAAQREAERKAADKGFWGDIAGTVVGTAAHFIPGYH